MDDAIDHAGAGIGLWEWACNDQGGEPDIVLAAAGDPISRFKLKQDTERLTDHAGLVLVGLALAKCAVRARHWTRPYPSGPG